MHERAEAARHDIAFIRAVVEDRGPLPALLGWHLVAIGVIWGLDFVHIWAIFTGSAYWPGSLSFIPWLPALIVYVPVNVWLNRAGRNETWGPSARSFGAAWAGMAYMTIPAVAVLLIAGAETSYPFYRVWPALAFILYGGAWVVAALVRRTWWCGVAAMLCMATALVCSLLIGSPVQWMVMAAGLLLLVAVPGIVIIRERSTLNLPSDG